MVTSEDRVKCQPVLMPGSSDIDILSQPLTCCPDAQGFTCREAKTHTGLMYLQSKAVWFGSEDLKRQETYLPTLSLDLPKCMNSNDWDDSSSTDKRLQFLLASSVFD